MKKQQLLTLALIALGYVTSTYTGGVFVMAQMGKLKTNVEEGTSQKVNAHALWVANEKPKIPNTTVLRLEEKGENKWIVHHDAPGTAVLHMKKKKPGHSKDHESLNHHRCKPALITVRPMGTAKRAMKAMKQHPTTVQLKHGETKTINAARVYLDPQSPKRVVSIHKKGDNTWQVRAHRSGTVNVLTKMNEDDDAMGQKYRVVKPQ